MKGLLEGWFTFLADAFGTTLKTFTSTFGATMNVHQLLQGQFLQIVRVSYVLAELSLAILNHVELLEKIVNAITTTNGAEHGANRTDDLFHFLTQKNNDQLV